MISFGRCFRKDLSGVGVVREIAAGKPEVFPGREPDEESDEMQPVLDLVKHEMAEQGLRFD